mgnify:CR=1 FL=1
MGFWEEISSEEEEDYNPYDHIANGRIRKCKRGGYISKNWCCRECWIEERVLRQKEEKARKNIFNFNDYPNNNYFKKEEEQEVDINWSNLKLIPPKTKKEIKKRYKLLCLRHHPDKGGKAQDFIKITDSYNIIYNETKF